MQHSTQQLVMMNNSCLKILHTTVRWTARRPAGIIIGRKALYNKNSLVHFIVRHHSSSISTAHGATREAVELPPAAAAAAAATTRQLQLVAMHAALPMIGFGFMDNLLMLLAGDLLDISFCVTFGFSTLTAMALGNTVSDIAGATFGEAVEVAAAKLKLPTHNLTLQQLNTKRARYWSTFGANVGITVGCLLGMVCLPFMDTEKADKAKKAKELQSIFESVMEEGHKLVNADRATLWMLDDKNAGNDDKLWSRVATGVKGIIEVPVKSGLVGACVQLGETINIPDAYHDPRFNASVDETT